MFIVTTLSNTIIGSVAGLSVPAESEKMAKDNGLLVLTQSGVNIVILNREGFKLREF
jgi:hypothetical protein